MTDAVAQLGILIKGPEVLESTRAIDTIVLDKTGTVTTGQMTLIDVVTARGEDADAPAGIIDDGSAADVGPGQQVCRAAQRHILWDRHHRRTHQLGRSQGEQGFR